MRLIIFIGESEIPSKSEEGGQDFNRIATEIMKENISIDK